MWAKLFVVAVALVLAPQSALGQVGTPFVLPTIHPSVFQVAPFLVHHDVIVGGNPLSQRDFQDNAPNRDQNQDSEDYGWTIPGAVFNTTTNRWTAQNRTFGAYAPIYANVGDRVVFEFADGNNVYRMKNREKYESCDMQGSSQVAASGIGGGVDKRHPNRKVVTLSQRGKFHFAIRRVIPDIDGNVNDDRSACSLGAKVTVHVDTEQTAPWDALSSTRNINHVWNIGAASNRYWSSLYLSLELGFQTLHISQFDRLDFEYDRTDDVRELKGHSQYKHCDFHGDTLQAGPLVGGGFNKPNRFSFVAEDVEDTFFASGGGTAHFDNEGLSAGLRPGYLRTLGLFWPESCKDGKMKVHVIVVGSGMQVSVPEAFPVGNIVGTNNYGLNDESRGGAQNPFLQYLSPFGFV